MVELSARVVEVRAIAQVLWFLPPPARAELGDKLHGLGVRVHPELATLELVREGPKAMGNHAPQQVVKKTADQLGMDALGKINPALTARIAASHADPAMAARIAAAKTNQERVELAREVGVDVHDDVLGQVSEIKRQVDALRPEDLE